MEVATYRQPWYEAETMDVAIGQGFVTATPLQIAVAYMVWPIGERSTALIWSNAP